MKPRTIQPRDVSLGISYRFVADCPDWSRENPPKSLRDDHFLTASKTRRTRVHVRSITRNFYSSRSGRGLRWWRREGYQPARIIIPRGSRAAGRTSCPSTREHVRETSTSDDDWPTGGARSHDPRRGWTSTTPRLSSEGYPLFHPVVNGGEWVGARKSIRARGSYRLSLRLIAKNHRSRTGVIERTARGVWGKTREGQDYVERKFILYLVEPFSAFNNGT